MQEHFGGGLAVFGEGLRQEVLYGAIGFAVLGSTVLVQAKDRCRRSACISAGDSSTLDFLPLFDFLRYLPPRLKNASVIHSAEHRRSHAGAAARAASAAASAPARAGSNSAPPQRGRTAREPYHSRGGRTSAARAAAAAASAASAAAPSGEW